MDLSLSDDQQLLVDSFSGLLQKECSPAVVRAAEPIGYDPSLWGVLRDHGVIEMAVPEAAGGWGASLADLCLVAECLGRACAPAPVIESQVAARLLAALHAPGKPLLDDVLGRRSTVTLALRHAFGDVAPLVPAAAVADVALISRRDALVAVPVAGAVTHRSNHGHLPLGDVVVPAAAEVLAVDGTAASAVDRAVDEWLLLTGSALVGLAAEALDVAVEYAKGRHAFGAPIGSFQGIAHRLADAATWIDGARLLVQDAAWLADTGSSEASERAAMAFAFATDAAKSATYWSVHTHGGYGVMVEYDAHLYFQRARGWSGVYGDAETAYLRVADRRYVRRAA